MDKDQSFEPVLIQNITNKEQVLENIINDYQAYNKNYFWARLVMVVFGIIIVGYNFLFAGKRFSIAKYNTITNTMVGICIFLACILFLIAIKAFRDQYKIRKQVKDTASTNQLDYKALKKELNFLLKSSLGGSGI